jgi:hypothetical protein
VLALEQASGFGRYAAEHHVVAINHMPLPLHTPGGGDKRTHWTDPFQPRSKDGKPKGYMRLAVLSSSRQTSGCCRLQFCQAPTKIEIGVNWGWHVSYQNCALLPVLIANPPWHPPCAAEVPIRHTI